jgi:hypothetical protein
VVLRQRWKRHICSWLGDVVYPHVVNIHIFGAKAIVSAEMAFAGHVFLLVFNIQTGGEGDRKVGRLRLNRGWSPDLRSPTHLVSRRSHRVGGDRESPGPEWGKRRAQRVSRGPTDEIA